MQNVLSEEPMPIFSTEGTLHQTYLVYSALFNMGNTTLVCKASICITTFADLGLAKLKKGLGSIKSKQQCFMKIHDLI